MTIVVINTSEPTARLALLHDEAVVAQRQWESTRYLGRILLEQLDDMLNEQAISLSDIGRMVVHTGPGHYSALRTGVVTATQLAHAFDVELTGSPSRTHEQLLREAPQLPPTPVVEPHYR